MQIESILFVIKNLDCNKAGGLAHFQMKGIFEKALKLFDVFFFPLCKCCIVCCVMMMVMIIAFI